MSAATQVLRDLPGRVHALTGADLDVVLPVVDALAAAAGAGRFTVTAEAVARGEVAGSQAGSVPRWVADRCPSLDAWEAGLVAKAVRELAVQAAASLAAAAAVAEGRLRRPGSYDHTPARGPSPGGPAPSWVEMAAGGARCTLSGERRGRVSPGRSPRSRIPTLTEEVWSIMDGPRESARSSYPSLPA